MKHLSVFLFFLISHFIVNAQQQIVERVSANGTITDEKTKEPIPYANFHFKKTYIGTSSDDEGRFKITVPKSMKDAIITISAVGYEPLTIPFSKIITEKDSIVIRLKQAIIHLPEIPIYAKDLSGYDILMKAFNNKINQPPAKHIYRIRYEGRGKEINGDTVYNVDALLEAGYYYRNEKWDWDFVIIEKRNNLSSDYNGKIDNLHFLNGNWHFRENRDFHHCNLNTETCKNQLKFQDNSYSLYDNIFCFVVQYEVVNPSPEQTTIFYQNIDSLKGIIYVDMINFRILRWEIFAAYKNSVIKKYKKGISMMNVYPIRYHYVRNYRIIKDISYPSLIQVIRTDRIIYKNKQIKTIQTTHNSYITDVILDKVHDNPYDNYRFDLNLTEYHKDFWNNYTDNYR